jgi:hypothetical protein
MTRVGRVENRISRVEGFRVRIKHLGGADVRSDRTGMPAWPFERAAKDAWTVADWKRERFSLVYPGFDVDVLDRRHQPVVGQTRLESVRSTYDRRARA